MKKFVMLALLVAGSGLTVLAQNNIKIPLQATKTLQSKFPKVEPTWKKNADNQYLADFEFSGSKTIAVFDDHGTFLESLHPLKVKKMPEPIKTTLNKDYKGLNVTESSIIETEKKEVFYKVVVEKGTELLTLRFNKDGGLVSTSKSTKQ